MKSFLASVVIAVLGAGPAGAATASVFPAIGAFLQIGAVPVAETGPDGAAPQDPFAQAAKVVFGRLRLEGRTLEWDKRDYETSSTSAQTARAEIAKKQGLGIHDMGEVLTQAGPDAWVILRDAKTGSSFFVFSKTDDAGETTFPNAEITSARERQVIDGKLWLSFPNGEAGSYQLVRLVPDSKQAIDRTFSFVKGRLEGTVEVASRSELDLLLKQPAFAEAVTSMHAAKLNDTATYAEGIRGFVDGEGQSLTLSQREDGTLSVGLKKGRDALYEITANKQGAELTAVGR